MKKLLILALIPVLAFAVEYDMQKGIDLTGRTSVTGSQLNQLVDNAITATNKGMIIWGGPTPDVAANSRYARFMWQDTNGGLPGITKVWNGSAWVTNAFGGAVVQTTNVSDGAITSAKLANSAVTTTKIADGAVTDTKLAAGSVTYSKYAAGSVSNVTLAVNSIDGTRLQDSAVTSAKIQDGNITSNKLASDSVITAKILDGNVTTAKLAANAVTTGKIGPNSIFGTNITDGTIGSSDIATSTITTNQLTNSIIGGLAKAWGTFKAANPVVVLGSYNVTSIARSGAGAYLVTFTTPFASTNYSVVTSYVDPGARHFIPYKLNTTTTVTVEVLDSSGVSADTDLPVSFSIDGY